MKTLINLVIFSFFIFEIYSQDSVSLELLDSNSYDLQNNCTKEGYLCKSCNQLIYCTQNEAGGFDEIVIEDCAPKTTCSLSQGKCTPDFNPSCSNYTPKCNNVGAFPNPTNCQQYFFCMKETTGPFMPYNYECTDGWTYDPKTTYCDIKGSCNETQLLYKKCTKVGDMGVVDINKSIWFICTKQGEFVLPDLRLCPNGKQFNPVTKICA